MWIFNILDLLQVYRSPAQHLPRSDVWDVHHTCWEFRLLDYRMFERLLLEVTNHSLHKTWIRLGKGDPRRKMKYWLRGKVFILRSVDAGFKPGNRLTVPMLFRYVCIFVFCHYKKHFYNLCAPEELDVLVFAIRFAYLSDEAIVKNIPVLRCVCVLLQTQIVLSKICLMKR